MSRNPWKTVPRPLGESYFKTMRVGLDVNPNNLPVSWAVDFEGNYAVYFEYPRPKKAQKDLKLPSFKSLYMRDIECGQSTRAFAVILKEASSADLFYEICCDLILSIQDMPPFSTRSVLVRRLERWSSLLRGEYAGLSAEKQRGLFAELLFLESLAIPTMGETNAVRGWVGPEGNHQDYHFGQTFVEIKSKHGSSSSKVIISSEHQLAKNDSERLFLYVLEENEANGNHGLSLTELAERVRNSIGSPIVRNEFFLKMLQVGYDFKTDYDTRWTTGNTNVYEVEGEFPRIADVESGLSHVSYALDLKECSDYEVDESLLLRCMRGIHG